jgi:archaellum component FlaC
VALAPEGVVSVVETPPPGAAAGPLFYRPDQLVDPLHDRQPPRLATSFETNPLCRAKFVELFGPMPASNPTIPLMSQIAALQAQLTASQVQATDLQNELTASVAEEEDLQGQLALSQAQISDVSARLDAVNNELAGVTAELAGANASLATAQGQMATLKAQVADRNAARDVLTDANDGLGTLQVQHATVTADCTALRNTVSQVVALHDADAAENEARTDADQAQEALACFLANLHAPAAEPAPPRRPSGDGVERFGALPPTLPARERYSLSREQQDI